MKVMFIIWGALGLIANGFTVLTLFTSASVGVGTSAYVSAMALIWIGGMVFFGLGSILVQKAGLPSAADVQITPQSEGNPYAYGTQEAQSWDRGVAARKA